MAGAVPSHLVTRSMRFDFVTGASMARGPINETSSLPVAALVWSGARRTPQEFSPPTRSDGWGPFLQTLRRIASAGAGGERGPRQQHDVAGRVAQSEKFLYLRPNLGSSPTSFPRGCCGPRSSALG